MWEMTTYSDYEKRSRIPYQRKCIDGKTTSPEKCVGYCRYTGHPGFLTKKLRQQHDCCNKQCDYYIRKEKEQLNGFQMQLVTFRTLLAQN